MNQRSNCLYSRAFQICLHYGFPSDELKVEKLFVFYILTAGKTKSSWRHVRRSLTFCMFSSSFLLSDQVDEAVRGLSDAAAGLLQEQPVQEAKRRRGRGGPVPGPAAHHGAAHQPALQGVHRLQRHRFVRSTFKAFTQDFFLGVFVVFVQNCSTFKNKFDLMLCRLCLYAEVFGTGSVEAKLMLQAAEAFQQEHK